MQRYRVALQCAACRAERLHDLTYLGNVFASAACTVCGETVRPRPDLLIANYVRDFERRLARKPGRMLTRARRQPLSFVFHYLPHGLVHKPREVLEEWETLVRINAAGERACHGARPLVPSTRAAAPSRSGSERADRPVDAGR